MAARPALLQEQGRRGTPNNVSSPQTRITAAVVARQSAQSRRTASPSAASSAVAAAARHTRVVGAPRALPDPYAPPDR